MYIYICIYLFIHISECPLASGRTVFTSVSRMAKCGSATHRGGRLSSRSGLTNAPWRSCLRLPRCAIINISIKTNRETSTQTM